MFAHVRVQARQCVFRYTYTRDTNLPVGYSSLSFSRLPRVSIHLSGSVLVAVHGSLSLSLSFRSSLLLSVRVIFAMRGVTGGEFTRDGDTWGVGWARVAEGVAQAAGNDISRPL